MNVSAFQLIQFKAAVKLEKLGMKHSSGRSVTAYVKKLFKLPRNTTHDAIITLLEEHLKGAKQCENREAVLP